MRDRVFVMFKSKGNFFFVTGTIDSAVRYLLAVETIYMRRVKILLWELEYIPELLDDPWDTYSRSLDSNYFRTKRNGMGQYLEVHGPDERAM